MKQWPLLRVVSTLVDSRLLPLPSVFLDIPESTLYPQLSFMSSLSISRIQKQGSTIAHRDLITSFSSDRPSTPFKHSIDFNQFLSFVSPQLYSIRSRTFPPRLHTIRFDPTQLNPACAGYSRTTFTLNQHSATTINSFISIFFYFSISLGFLFGWDVRMDGMTFLAYCQVLAYGSTRVGSSRWWR
jgi:hypothetical protein